MGMGRDGAQSCHTNLEKVLGAYSITESSGLLTPPIDPICSRNVPISKESSTQAVEILRSKWCRTSFLTMSLTQT